MNQAMNQVMHVRLDCEVILSEVLEFALKQSERVHFSVR